MSTHTAVRLPRNRGPAAWNAILGPQPPAQPLEDTITADVAVVGAGFAGLSAARRLRQLRPEARIVVLDAARLADGPAGRNSGFMIDLPHELTSEDYAGAGDDRAQIAMNRHAIAFARDAVEDYQIAPAYFDPAGKVNGAVSEAADAHNQSYAKHLQELGEPFELLDAQAMREMTGSAHYRGGLYTPGTVMLQPAGYIRGLAAGLSDTTEIYEDSPVTEMTRAGRDWRVNTPKGSVTAPQVIMATNGHLESFGFARGRLMHLMLYASMTAPMDADARAALGGAGRWGITPSDPMGTTVRRIDGPQGGDRLIIRSCATLRSEMAPSAGDMARAAQVHRQKFENRFPQLSGMKMEHVWSGHLCLSLNGVAVAGQLEDGLFSACVQNGLGTARGTLTGMAAAEAACGVETDITRHFAAEDMPKRLPPRPVRDIGANTVLRWREWKARAE